MGTPDFAVPTLLEIVGSGHEIAAVYTRAQQPAGRGMAPRESAVAHEAERFGLPIFTPKTLRDRDAAEAMRAHGADAAVVVASVVSTCMPRCCRAGAARRRSSAPSWPATARPASW
jgi:methionyl-tRNA formyltransferase